MFFFRMASLPQFLFLLPIIATANSRIIETLQHDLFKEYDPKSRPPTPSGSYNSGIDLFAHIIPNYLIEVRDNEGSATFVIFVFLHWCDPRLTWDPSEYEGLDYIDLETSEMIWFPKLTMAAILRQEDIMQGDHWLGLSSDGFVQTGMFYRLEQSNMEFTAKDFPFDTLKIHMYLLTPYSVDSVQLRLLESSKVTSNLRTMVDWKFKTFSCSLSMAESIFLKTPINYTYINCNLKVQRQPAHYLVNFCIPCLIVSILAVLGIHSASSVTTARTSKYELGVASLMSIWLLALPITEIMPRSGKITRLHILYFGLVGTVLSSTVMSWVSVVCQRRNNLQKKSSGMEGQILLHGDGNYSIVRSRNYFRIADFISVFVHLAAQLILMIWFCNIWDDD